MADQTQIIANTSNLFEIIATVEQEETGVFSAVLSRAGAMALDNAGYSMNEEGVPAQANEVFGILIISEEKLTGVFRAVLARKKSEALVAAGLTLIAK